MKEQENIPDNGRRGFIKNVAIAALATATCGSLSCSKFAANWFEKTYKQIIY